MRKEGQSENNKDDFTGIIAAPARRALKSLGITNLEELARYTEKEISELHGMGPNALVKLKSALEGKKLRFRE